MRHWTIGILAAAVLTGCGTRFAGVDYQYQYTGPRSAEVWASPPSATTTVALPAVAIGRPAGLAYDAQGQLVAANAEDGLLVTVSRHGTGMTRADNLHDPKAVTVDRHGNVYVVLGKGGSVIRVGASEIRRVATGLESPSGVAVTADGTLYVSQTDKKSVIAISPDGVRKTVWQSETLVPGPLAVTKKDEIFLAVKDGDKGKLLQISRTGKVLDTYYFDRPVTGIAAGRDDRLLVVAGAVDEDGYLRGDVGWLERDGTWTIYAEDVIDPLAVAVSPANEPVYVQYDWDSDSYQIVTVTGEQAAAWLKSS